MEQRVHGGRSRTLKAVALVRGQRVGQGARPEQRDGRERHEGEHCIQTEEHDADDDHLEHRDHPLLKSIDQHPLDGRHVLEHPRHKVPGRPIVKPSQRQLLHVRVKVAAEIEDDMLLEGIVQEQTQAVEHMLRHERSQEDANKVPEQLRMMRPHNIVDDVPGDPRKDDYHRRACARAKQRERAQHRIAFQVGEDAAYGLLLHGWESGRDMERPP